MKNILLLVAVLFVFGCKKETPNPSTPGPGPTPATPGDNWFAVGVDTVWLEEFNGYKTVSSGTTTVIGVDTTDTYGNVGLYIPVTTTDSIFMTGTNSFVNATNSGPNYVNLQMTLKVTRYDAVGGLIEGWYDGVGYHSITNAQVNIKGEFSVIRGADQ